MSVLGPRSQLWTSTTTLNAPRADVPVHLHRRRCRRRLRGRACTAASRSRGRWTCLVVRIKRLCRSNFRRRCGTVELWRGAGGQVVIEQSRPSDAGGNVGRPSLARARSLRAESPLAWRGWCGASGSSSPGTSRCRGIATTCRRRWCVYASTTVCVRCGTC